MDEKSNNSKGQEKGHKPASFAPYTPGGSPRPSKAAHPKSKKPGEQPEGTTRVEDTPGEKA
jgi:hypothetical protein